MNDANNKRPSHQPLLTISDIAERDHVSERTVRRWIASGDLAVHRFGRLIRIDPEDHLRFRRAHRDD